MEAHCFHRQRSILGLVKFRVCMSMYTCTPDCACVTSCPLCRRDSAVDLLSRTLLSWSMSFWLAVAYPVGVIEETCASKFGSSADRWFSAPEIVNDSADNSADDDVDYCNDKDDYDQEDVACWEIRSARVMLNVASSDSSEGRASSSVA